MNQTNFGYNPQRQTLVNNNHKNANELVLDSINSGVRAERGSLNTQKRNRTSNNEGSTITPMVN
jgi:hypothetical protein